jgi:hypothetical protein
MQNAVKCNSYFHKIVLHYSYKYKLATKVGVIMKIEHLKIFLEVAQSESINKAAGKLFTSHQNLNVLLKKIEEELGTALFLRSNKGITLSDDGKALFDAASQIVAIYDELQNKLQKDTGVLNFYTTTSLASLINDLQGSCFCNNYISVYKKNVDEIFSMIESKKKGIYFVSVTEKEFKMLEQFKDHCVVSSDNTSVRIYHKDNPFLTGTTTNVTPRMISNISQSQLATDMINIDDLSISKKLMREEHFYFSTTESLAQAYFPEEEWVHVKDTFHAFPVKFTLFFNLPNTHEWREARMHIAERIRNNFHNATL